VKTGFGAKGPKTRKRWSIFDFTDATYLVKLFFRESYIQRRTEHFLGPLHRQTSRGPIRGVFPTLA
jgi:hypothetical protein